MTRRYEPTPNELDQIAKCPDELSKTSCRIHFELDWFRQSSMAPYDLARLAGVHWATREAKMIDEWGPASRPVEAGFRLGIRVAQQIMGRHYLTTLYERHA